MRIGHLRVNDQKNPLGIELSKLVFSWEVTEAAGLHQKHSRLEIAWDPEFSMLVYDSGERILPSFGFTPELEDRLEDGAPYYWRVAVTDDTGDHAVSAPASFEGGRRGSFRGKWITPAFTHEVHPVLKKSFSLASTELQSRSRLYICGLGLYEAYLNGERVGDQFLTPYFTDYRYRIQYQTYDVAPLLREGENTLEVWLGEGWYKGRFGYMAGGQLREYYGDSFRLIEDLVIGDRVIATDEDWQCLRSPVLNSGIYDGETFDIRRLAAIRTPSLREITPVRLAEAPAAPLVPMVGLPVVRRERFAVAEVITTPRGETVLDFGQELTGWVEFTLTEQDRRDQHILLQYGEVLQDGCFYNDNLRTAQAQFQVITDGSRHEAVRPHFTFFGFRYVRVTGMTVTADNAGDFTAVALYSDLEEIGEITTANDKINRLILNTKWGQKGNFLDIPTDCPQRDERCGWTGDAEIFAGAASYHMRTGAFFRKYLRDMADEQREKDGAVPYVVPDVLTVGREKLAEPPYDMSGEDWGEAGASVWGDAATIIPWQLYLHTGSLSRLAEQYDNMKQWTDFIVRMEETHCGGSRLWSCGFHFGDWLSLDAEESDSDMDNREGGTDKTFIASVFYMYAARLTSQAAALIGKQEDAVSYGQRADEVRSAIRAKYLDPVCTGGLTIQTQTAYATAIYLGVFEEAELPAAGEALVQLVHDRHDHLSTGFVGTAYLCDALTKTGHADVAYTLLFNEDYPSWLYEVNLGATTIWERWNSLLPDGHISGTGMNSLNHYAYGVIVEWIYSAVCGLVLDPTHPAGQRVILRPHPDARLGSAEASVRFAVGSYRAGWQLDGERITYTFTVPFDGCVLFRPDQALSDLTLNGQSVTAEAITGPFHAGTYTIEGLR